MDCYSSGMINLKELSLVGGKAAWMVYLVSCLFVIFCVCKFRKLAHDIWPFILGLCLELYFQNCLVLSSSEY